MWLRWSNLELSLGHRFLISLLEVLVTGVVKLHYLLDRTFCHGETVMLAFIATDFETTIFHSFSANGFSLLFLFCILDMLLSLGVVAPLHAFDLSGGARLLDKLNIAPLFDRLEPIVFFHDMNACCSRSFYRINNFNFSIGLIDFDGFFKSVLSLFLECGKLISVVHWNLS